jgi:hypothetical protein
MGANGRSGDHVGEVADLVEHRTGRGPRSAPLRTKGPTGRQIARHEKSREVPYGYFGALAGVAGLEPATPGFGVRGSALTPRNFPQRMSPII